MDPDAVIELVMSKVRPTLKKIEKQLKDLGSAQEDLAKKSSMLLEISPERSGRKSSSKKKKSSMKTSRRQSPEIE